MGLELRSRIDGMQRYPSVYRIDTEVATGARIEAPAIVCIRVCVWRGCWGRPWGRCRGGRGDTRAYPPPPVVLSDSRDQPIGEVGAPGHGLSKWFDRRVRRREDTFYSRDIVDERASVKVVDQIVFSENEYPRTTWIHRYETTLNDINSVPFSVLFRWILSQKRVKSQFWKCWHRESISFGLS